MTLVHLAYMVTLYTHFSDLDTKYCTNRGFMHHFGSTSGRTSVTSYYSPFCARSDDFRENPQRFRNLIMNQEWAWSHSSHPNISYMKSCTTYTKVPRD